MEGKKISQLIPDTSPSTDDFIVTVDGTTMQNKRVDLGNLPVSNPTNVLFDSKVDKAPGKQLSDQNYTQGEKNKLAGIEAGAEVNEVTQADLVHNHDTRYANQALGVMAKTKSASMPSSYGFLGQKFTNGVAENDLVIYGESTQAGTPTPDAPVPIVSTTGNVTVRSEGKNLLPLVPGANTTTWGVSRTWNSDGSVTLNGKATGSINIVLPFAMPLVLTGQVTHAVGTPLPSGVFASMSDQSETLLNASNVSRTWNADGIKSYASYIIYIENGATLNNIIFKPQVEAGSVATIYEKNTRTTQTLPLGTTQLRSLPNGVSDRIYKSGDSWYLEQNVGSITTDGVGKSWTAYSLNLSGHQRVYINVLSELNAAGGKGINIAQPAAQMSNTYISGGVGTYNYGGPNRFHLDENNNINLIRAAGTPLADFQAGLIANPLNMLYQLAPVTTSITDPTLITALENIRTYQGITYITASTPVSGSYGLDMTATLDGKVNKAGDTMTGNLIIPAPTLSTHATTKSYVDNRTPIYGTGFPNGVVSAAPGRIYIDENITNGASSWIKKSGTGNTGWSVLEGYLTRNITSLCNVASGTVYVERSGRECHIILVDVLASAAAVVGANLEIINGFSTILPEFTPSRSRSGVVTVFDTNARRLQFNSSALTVRASSTTDGVNGSITYLTNQSWPTTLPGIST